MVGSCGVDASVVASWVGWIRTLTSTLVVSLGGIVSSARALSWSYELWWFKEVSNGVRDFVCVISVRGLSSLDAWLHSSIGIFATSFGFTRCFCKPSSISQVNFAIWRPFRSLEVISQPFWSLEAILQQKGDFTANGGFRSPFRSQRGIFAAKGQFRSQGPISQPKGIFTAISQPKGDFAGHFVAHFAAAKWGWRAAKWHSCANGVFRSCENFHRG